MVTPVVGHELVVGGADRPTPSREQVDEIAPHAVDLPDRDPDARARGSDEPDAEPLHELLLDQGVVALRRGDVEGEQHARVQAAPLPVVAHRLRRDRDVGVQVRVTGAGVQVVEGCRCQAAGVDLLEPAVPGASDRGLLLEPSQRVLPGVRVRLADLLADVVVGQTPQHRDRLRRREYQVEA